MKTPPLDNKEVALLYPWDDDADDDDGLLDQQFDDATNNIGNSNNAADVPNHLDGTYAESAHESALRFGIRFTTEQYHKTKLLKLLSDANAPHYLYKEIIEWGQAAQRDTYILILSARQEMDR